MTNKEAIELLKELENEVYNEDRNGYKQYEALELAIKSLEERPTINCKDCDGYEAGYSAGLKDAERQQGEWIKIFENPFTNGYICPFCGHKIQVTEQFLPKVTECENCGADMRGDNNG